MNTSLPCVKEKFKRKKLVTKNTGKKKDVTSIQGYSTKKERWLKLWRNRRLTNNTAQIATAFKPI